MEWKNGNGWMVKNLDRIRSSSFKKLQVRDVKIVESFPSYLYNTNSNDEQQLIIDTPEKHLKGDVKQPIEDKKSI